MAKQTFQVSVEFLGNISQLQSQIKQVTGELNRMGQTSGGAQIQSQFNNLTKALTDLQSRASQPIGSSAEFNRLEQDLNKVEQGYLSLLQTVDRMRGLSDAKKLELLPADQQSRIKQAEAALQQYEQQTSKLSGTVQQLQNKTTAWTKKANEAQGLAATFKTVSAQATKAKNTYDSLKQAADNLSTAQRNYNKLIDETGNKKANVSQEEFDTAKTKLEQAQIAAQKLAKGYDDIGSAVRKAKSDMTTLNNQKTSINTQMNTAKAAAEKLGQEVEELKGKLESTQGEQLKATFEQLKAKAQELGISLEGIDDVSSIETLKSRLQELRTQGLEQANTSIDQMSGNLRSNFGPAIQNSRSNLSQLRTEFDKFNNKLQEVNQLKSYITYFFSLTNSVYLFRSAIQSAFETVKELDAAMTETAVVTDFSINDMWEKLPEYTKNASKLGASTKELYEATTLYYQQGLKGQAVMDVGIETMKMARIAGMEATEATEAMTAALRGFNMEVNQINAERVNDVYSELAAITAADTEQIATAMTKTASIAHNANMEFETTAALLAQIIETTQEAPETAGTAMKTIIARFSEVKELQNRGEKTGEDEEGEEIDVNKIDKALKSVNISMEDFFAGTKGLDEILLELAEKWDTLDFTTQRYIATAAAGSRQQSRFIAMMSDYSRTMELVDAAQNSAGASQRQFEKTLDSLKAKMNKLSNAWDEFTMGLANNEFIKMAVDALTGLITAVNWSIDKLSELFGLMDGEADTVDNLVKSILTLGTAIAAIAGARALLNFGFGKLVDGLETRKLEAQTKYQQKQKDLGLSSENEGGQALETSAANAGKTLETSATSAGEAFKKAVLEAAGKETAHQEEQQIDDSIHQEEKQADDMAHQQSKHLDEDVHRETDQIDEDVHRETDQVDDSVHQESERTKWSIHNDKERMKDNLGGGSGGFGQSIKSWWKNNKAMIGWGAAILVSIAAISSITNAATKATDEANETTEEQLSNLATMQETVSEALNQTSQDLKNFSQTKKDLKNMIKSLDTLKRGSADWASTMHTVRTEISDILNKFPELRNHVEQVNGVSTLSEEGWQLYEKMLVERQYQQEIMLNSLKMQETLVQNRAKAEGLNLKTTTVTQAEQESIQTGQTAGGWAGGALGGIGGAIAGVKIFGSLGSMAGPIGALVGAVVGALIGVFAGELIGGIGATDGVSLETLDKVALAAVTYENNGEVGFTAEGATPEEVAAFLSAQNLAAEDYELLNEYIKLNGAEFDTHTQAMAYASEQLIQYGRRIGELDADNQGYTGQTAAAYANMSEYIFGRDWIKETEYQRVLLGNLVTQEHIDYIIDQGYYSSYDTNEKVFIREGGSEAELTDDQILDLVAQGKASEALLQKVDDTFNWYAAQGAPGELAALVQGDHDEDYYKDYSYDTLANPELWNFVEAQKQGYEAVSENFGVRQEEATARFLTEKSQDVDYGFYYDRYKTEEAVNILGKSYSKAVKKDKNTLQEERVFRELNATEAIISGTKEDFIEDWTRYDVYDPRQDRNTIDIPRNVQVSYDKEKMYQIIEEQYGIPRAIAEDALNGGSYEATYNTDVLLPLIEKYKSLLGEGGDLSFLSGVAIETVDKIVEKYQSLASIHGLDVTKSFYEPLENLYNNIKDLDENTRNNIMNLVAGTDITSLDDLNTTISIIEAIPGITDEAISGLEDWKDSMEEAGIAVSEIDLDTLTKQLTEAFEIIKKIDNIELGEVATFTQEEIASLISGDRTGSLSKDSFVSTVDGYVYLGESMDKLRQTIETSNSILLGLQLDAIQKKVETGKFIGEHESLSSLSWQTYSSWGADQIAGFVKKAIPAVASDVTKKNQTIAYQEAYDKAKAEGKTDAEAKAAGTKARDAVQATTAADIIASDKFAEYLIGTPLEGINPALLKDLYNSTINGGLFAKTPSAVLEEYKITDETFLSTYFADLADSFLNLTTYKTQAETGIKDLKMNHLSTLSGQEMIQMIGKEDEKGNKYSEEDVDKALAAQAELEGTDITGYEIGQQIYKDTGGADLKTEEERNAAWKEAHRLGQALALDATKNQKEYSGLVKVFDNYTSVVTKANRGTEAYRQGLSKIKAAMEDAYDIELTEQFMLDHADIIERILAGDQKAWKEWQTLVTKQINSTVDNIYDLDKVASTINPNIGVTTTFDSMGLYQAQLGLRTFGSQVVATQEQIDALTSMYDMLGATVEFTYSERDVWIKDGLITTVEIEGAKKGKIITGMNVTNTGSSGLDNYSPSGGGGDSSEWENSYDEYYNAVKKINAELRKREQLERQYSRLLDRNAATANNLAKSQKDQLASLRSEYGQRKTLKGNRERQMQGIESEYSDLSKYAWYDEELGQVQINWKLLEGLDGSTDEELTERVDEYISKLEEQQDLIEQEQDEMEEIEDAIWELYEQGKDEYFDLEDQIKEAIIADRQKEIDKLSEINDTITDTNSKLLDSMQEQLDEYRQNRDNEKTEEELSDKQRRLAYLQQDTSGANALEIMQLQEELDEATEDYTDTLIDQKITELQEQNDKAAEQRQQQIDIMQDQLDQYSDSAAIWEKVNQLMTEGLDKDTGLIRGSRLEELLKSADGFDGMSKLKKMDWLNELNGNVAQALAWLETGALQTLFGQGKEVTFKDKNGNIVTGTINKDGDVEVKDKDGNVTGVYGGDSFKVDAEGNITSSEGSEEATANWEATQTKEPEKKAWSYSWPMPSTGSKTLKKGSTGDRVKGLQQALNDLGFRAGKIDGIFGSNTDQAVRAFQRAAKEWYPEVGSDDGKVGPNTRAAFASHPLYQFKTGGLADFTGPAWLDGTKSKPEYILNADQTKAFFTLVDVLSGLQTGTPKSSEKTGDNTYDIDINVESIGSDYDVEQLANTVKRLINDDARYRNNNAISLTR